MSNEQLKKMFNVSDTGCHYRNDAAAKELARREKKNKKKIS